VTDPPVTDPPVTDDTVTDPLGRLRTALADREAAGLRRWLQPRSAADDLLDLAGNDYLSLTRHPRVVAAAADAARAWGAGSTGSRLVTGTTELHRQLEDELAAFVGADAGLVFSSGYLANLAVVTVLGGPDVTVLSDSGNHASIVDACRLSRSPVVVVPHCDLDKVDAALQTVSTPHALVVTDGVFSVDGDLAPLRGLHHITRRHGALLVVDEAHALGVVGPGGAGSVAAAGLAGAPDVIRTVTLSKSLGGQGGGVLADRAVVDLLISTARPFIFDTGLAPSSAAAALAALAILREEPERAERVRTAASRLAEMISWLGVQTVRPAAAVVPACVGDARRAVQAAKRCLDEGVRVGCFRPPSVRPGRSCLRLTAHANLAEADFDRASRALRRALR
jgi:8-amino-7-oxononanoate synthase